MNKDQLYEKYRFLVYKVIKDLGCKYRNDDEFEEYKFWGDLGLIKAINNFDESKNQTSTFFYKSIKNSILQLFKMKTADVRRINYMYLESLDAPIKEEKYYKEFHEVIPDENVHIEEDFVKEAEYQSLYKAIDKLKPHYKKILCNYFGINCEKKSLESMAKDFGISRQAVAVKKDNAVRDLKKILIKMGEIEK